MVPYDAIAIYILRNDELIPEYVNGDNYRLFSSLRIPLGQGLSGWVAQNRKPIVNGNPSVEPGYLNDPTKFSTLSSALAVPLEGVAGIIGVLALYRGERDAFTTDHLRILLAVSSKMALSIENAVLYESLEEQVRERTEQLEVAQKELVERAHMAGMADVAIGVLQRSRLGRLLGALADSPIALASFGASATTLLVLKREK